MALSKRQIAQDRSLARVQSKRTIPALTLQPRLQSSRLPELDALRGLMLIGMTLTHLPTQASHYSNQLLGFVSWAEGFVLLSAVLTGRVYGSILQQRSWREVFERLWLRCAKLYGYHLGLLAVAFTLVAAIAVHTQKPALLGLLDFYLAHHALAVGSSLLLLYCPPLLDILPMYIAFLMLTPFLLGVGQRWGWKFVLAPSGLLWLAAQFGMRGLIHGFLAAHAAFPIPLQNLGSFDLFAWQFLWIFGLWLGAGDSARLLDWFKSRWTIALASLVAADVPDPALSVAAAIHLSPRGPGKRLGALRQMATRGFATAGFRRPRSVVQRASAAHCKPPGVAPVGAPGQVLSGSLLHSSAFQLCGAVPGRRRRRSPLALPVRDCGHHAFGDVRVGLVARPAQK